MANFLSSHLLHFIVMGTGIAMIMGLLTPTQRWDRTKKSIVKYWLGLVGIVSRDVGCGFQSTDTIDGPKEIPSWDDSNRDSRE
jgi:hypothetical protein